MSIELKKRREAVMGEGGELHQHRSLICLLAHHPPTTVRRYFVSGCWLIATHPTCYYLLKPSVILNCHLYFVVSFFFLSDATFGPLLMGSSIRALFDLKSTFTYVIMQYLFIVFSIVYFRCPFRAFVYSISSSSSLFWNSLTAHRFASSSSRTLYAKSNCDTYLDQ
jgi:hypothetical protein